MSPFEFWGFVVCPAVGEVDFWGLAFGVSVAGGATKKSGEAHLRKPDGTEHFRSGLG
jgi:hypothetical protein